jgi:hypothetical protein
VERIPGQCRLASPLSRWSTSCANCSRIERQEPQGLPDWRVTRGLPRGQAGEKPQTPLRVELQRGQRATAHRAIRLLRRQHGNARGSCVLTSSGRRPSFVCTTSFRRAVASTRMTKCASKLAAAERCWQLLSRGTALRVQRYRYVAAHVRGRGKLKFTRIEPTSCSVISSKTIRVDITRPPGSAPSRRPTVLACVPRRLPRFLPASPKRCGCARPARRTLESILKPGGFA